MLDTVDLLHPLVPATGESDRLGTHDSTTFEVSSARWTRRFDLKIQSWEAFSMSGSLTSAYFMFAFTVPAN